MDELTEEERSYLRRLRELAQVNIDADTHDKDAFEVDELTSLDEISEGNDGVWVRGWVFVSNEQLRRDDDDDEEEEAEET